LVRRAPAKPGAAFFVNFQLLGDLAGAHRGTRFPASVPALQQHFDRKRLYCFQRVGESTAPPHLSRPLLKYWGTENEEALARYDRRGGFLGIGICC
jgi:hypothetical protein